MQGRFFYIIIQKKQADTHEKNDATKEIIIGFVKFLVLAPAKYTLAI